MIFNSYEHKIKLYDGTAFHNEICCVCGEEVTEADILGFCLDGHLKLSVNLVNDTMGIPCHIVDYKKATLDEAIANDSYPDELSWEAMPVEIEEYLKMAEPEKVIPKKVLTCLQISEDQYLLHEKFVLAMIGVWDLPMLGNELTFVKSKYYDLTGGQSVRSQLRCLKGVFLSGSDGRIHQLQRTPDDEEFQRGSRAELETINQDIANNNISEKEGEALLSQHFKDRMVLAALLNSSTAFDDCCPMHHLPQDSVLVVRTQALREFEQLISENEVDNNTARQKINAYNANQSDKLSMLIEASESFWKNALIAERDTHPTNEEVSIWLVKKGFSKSMADAGATIIRPKGAGTGRKPE